MMNRDSEIKAEKNADKSDVLAGKEKASREIFDWVQTFCQALFAVIIVFTFFLRFVTVDGTSMNDTLAHNDRLIISNVAYTPERGDIVVVHDLETQIISPLTFQREQAFRGPIIKRVIATEGEKVVVDYDNWTITVTDVDGNEFVLEEPYVKYMEDRTLIQPQAMFYPQSIAHKEEHIVAQGHVFVCGDNRNNSLDSRWVGDIDKRKILGKVLVRVFPNTKIMHHVDYEK